MFVLYGSSSISSELSVCIGKLLDKWLLVRCVVWLCCIFDLDFSATMDFAFNSISIFLHSTTSTLNQRMPQYTNIYTHVWRPKVQMELKSLQWQTKQFQTLYFLNRWREKSVLLELKSFHLLLVLSIWILFFLLSLVTSAYDLHNERRQKFPARMKWVQML